MEHTVVNWMAICDRMKELELKQQESDRMNAALHKRAKGLELKDVQNRLEVIEYDVGLIKLAQSADILINDIVFYVFQGRLVNVATLLQLYIFFNPSSVNVSKGKKKSYESSSSFRNNITVEATAGETIRYQTLEKGLTDLRTLDSFIVDIKHARNLQVHPALSRLEKDSEIECFTGHVKWEMKRKSVVKILQQVSIFVRNSYTA